MKTVSFGLWIRITSNRRHVGSFATELKKMHPECFFFRSSSMWGLLQDTHPLIFPVTKSHTGGYGEQEGHKLLPINSVTQKHSVNNEQKCLWCQLMHRFAHNYTGVQKWFKNVSNISGWIYGLQKQGSNNSSCIHSTTHINLNAIQWHFLVWNKKLVILKFHIPVSWK